MSRVATILDRGAGKIRFSVDEVEPASKLLTVESGRVQLERRLDCELLAFSHDEVLQLIPDRDIHPLALAVHTAFSEHRPLQLTPDIIWITLAQGFAQHINNHAETLRARFVRHPGKEKLVVEVMEFPTQSQQWVEKIEAWVLQIRDFLRDGKAERVGADCYSLLECNFSTTTPISRTVSHVVMMDAFQQYFDFMMACICGIPEVTLSGTVADWQSIYDRVRIMAAYDLEWWTDRVLPICAEFVATASGNPDLDFWQCIYKPAPTYGAELITGWLADLFPYIQHHITHAASIRNPVLAIDRCELPTQSETNPLARFGRKDGIAPSCLPLGLSVVPIEFQLQATGTDYPLDLVAGFVGVCQDPQLGTLTPELGWLVRSRDDRFEKLLDKIQQEHITQVPADWSDVRQLSLVPKDLIQMLERFDGATLYADRDNSWQIQPCQIWQEAYETLGTDDYSLWVHPFITLNAERYIAFTCDYRSREWLFILGRTRITSDRSIDPDSPHRGFTNPLVIARSAIELFDRIFAADGAYYFDDPEFIASPSSIATTR